MSITFQIITKKPEIHIGGKSYQRVEDMDGNIYLFAETFPFAEGTSIEAATCDTFGSKDVPEAGYDNLKEWMDYYKTRIVTNIKPLDMPDEAKSRFDCYMTLRQYLSPVFAMQMVNTYSLDLLMAHVEENPYWFYGPLHDFSIENFSLIDTKTEVSTFDLRQQQLIY